MRVSSLFALAAVAGLAAADSPEVGDRRRRCACCRMPSNRCPCRHCGACSTSGSISGTCACGRTAKDDSAGGDERSSAGGSLDGLDFDVPGEWRHPTQTNDARADLCAAAERVRLESERRR